MCFRAYYWLIQGWKFDKPSERYVVLAIYDYSVFEIIELFGYKSTPT